MKSYRATTTSKYFTTGNIYYAFDYLPGGGIVTADDNNKTHYINAEYLKANFEEVQA